MSRLPNHRAIATSVAEQARAEIRRRVARADLCRRSLAHFARYAIAAGAVDGIQRVEWGPHLDALCWSIQLQLESWLVAYGHGTPEMIARQREAWERTGATWEDNQPEPWLRYVLVQNAIWNVPPTTLKSTIALVLANAWIWLWCPRFAFGAASGIDSNVDRDSKATRDLVRSRWYRETFSIAWRDEDLEDASTIAVKRDSDAVSDWATSAGGKRRSRTINAGFTGTHVDGMFIDDPDDADKVWGEADRVRPQNRFSRAIETRVNCELRTIRLVLQQRVHPEDFTAYLLAIARWSPANPKGWAQLCIPARFGRGPEDAPAETPWGWKDWRTDADQMIHPRITAGVIADKLLKLGAMGVAGQYDQNPKRITSGMFERRHARFFVLEGDPMPTRRRPDGCLSREELPPVAVKLDELTRLTLSVDAANSLDDNPGGKKKRSAVGLGVIGCRGEERFVLDDRTRLLGPSDTYRAIFAIMRAWPLERVLVELKALGTGAIDEITRSIRRGWYLDEHDERVPLVGPDGDPVRCTVEVFQPGQEGKPQRAHGMVPPWEQGLILFRDGADWLYPRADVETRKTVDEGMIEEVCSFPGAARNDRVDYLSQVVAHYRGTTDTRSRWKAMGRLGLVAQRRG